MNGSKIRALRRSRGWGQQRLAVEAGLNTMTVSRAERGRTVAMNSATGIARALDVPVDDLLNDDSEAAAGKEAATA